MTSIKLLSRLLVVSLLCLLAACANTQRAAEDTAAAEAKVAADKAAMEAEMEAQRVQEEKLLAEEKTKQQAAREAADKAAAELLAKQQAEQARQRQAAPARSQNPDQRAAEIARQQARIADLRAKIAANNAEAQNLDSANTSLREAITAAEQLSATLTAEQQKYANTDPATGKTTQSLEKAKIDELAAQVEKLRTQAAELAKQQP